VGRPRLGVFPLGVRGLGIFGDSAPVGESALSGEPKDSNPKPARAAPPAARLPYCGSTNARAIADAGVVRGTSAIGKRAVGAVERTLLTSLDPVPAPPEGLRPAAGSSSSSSRIAMGAPAPAVRGAAAGGWSISCNPPIAPSPGR
jgi:hypothetical protein